MHSPSYIWAYLKRELPFLRTIVRKFQTHGSDSLVLYRKDFGQPLIFTMVDFKKGAWKLEPYKIVG